MTKRQRTSLFYTFLFLFFVFTPLLLFYYAGYRIDFQKRTVTQTGAIYAKIVPKNTSIQLRGDHARKTDWLFGAILIDNLLPKSYSLIVEKEGYIPWEKTLEVRKKEVTEIKNIILIPQNLQLKTLTESVKKIWVSPDRLSALLEKNTPLNRTRLSLWNVQDNTERIIFDNIGPEVSFISWRKDSDAILILLKEKSGFSTLLYEKDKDSKTLTFLGKDVLKAEFASSSGTSILLEKTSAKGSRLLLSDYGAQTLSIPFAENVARFEQDADIIFWIDAKGGLWKKETLSSSPPTPLAPSANFSLDKKSFVLADKNSLFLTPTSQGIFFQNGTTLMLLEKEKQMLETIQEGVKEFSLSPDEKKIAVSSGNEIKLFFLKEDQDQPKRNKGETVRIATFKDPVSNLTWITSHYLLFTEGSALKVAEIDTRDRVNIADIGLFSSSPFFWNPSERTLLLLNEGTLSISEKLF